MANQDYLYHQIAKQKKINLKKIRDITFLIFYAIFAFYFLVNGQGIFRQWDTGYTLTTLIYMVGVAVFLSIREQIPSNLEKPLNKSIMGFMGSFISMTIAFTIIKDLGLYFNNISEMPIAEIPFTLVYQLVIVVASEEIIFRGILLEEFHQIHWLFAVFGTAMIFSLFHLVAYGGNIGSMSIAFVLGIIFALCVYRWNIGVSMGVHFAWNGFVLGATALI